MTIDLDAVRGRYSAALDARPSKGTDIGSKGYNALTDAVADIPALLDALEASELERDVYIRSHGLMVAQFKIMQREKEHGWLEARAEELVEERARTAEAKLDRIREYAAWLEDRDNVTDQDFWSMQAGEVLRAALGEQP